MKLGIAVVYMFGAEHEPLLDLHLRQIDKCTTVPYVIYGSVNRLDTDYRQRLEEFPHVRAVELPPTELREMYEHSYYLDHLIQIAVDDGATHIATLHLDSFPIRAGWIEELAAHLTDTCVIVTPDRINTACLVFGRDFYLRHKPTMLVSESVQATPEYRSFLRACNPEQHSGIGFGFAAFANALSCYYLPVTKSHNDHGCVYDDMIFHLVGTIRLQPTAARGAVKTPSLLSRALLSLGPVYRLIVPLSLQHLLRARFPRCFDHLIDKPRAAIDRRRIAALERELLQSPDAFLDQLRN